MAAPGFAVIPVPEPGSPDFFDLIAKIDRREVFGLERRLHEAWSEAHHTVLMTHIEEVKRHYNDAAIAVLREYHDHQRAQLDVVLAAMGMTSLTHVLDRIGLGDRDQ